jgi:hypothetical protein
MPRPRPESAGRRGPIARQPQKSQTGFRIDDRTRFELQAAALYVGCENLQAVLDLAVREFLDRMKQVQGFEETLRTAELQQQRRAGVGQLPPKPSAGADPGSG